MPTFCIDEVFKRLLTQRGEEDALQVIGIMLLGILTGLNREIAVDAAQISAELKMAMADSIILATTRAYNAPPWTQEADIKGMEGVQKIEKR